MALQALKKITHIIWDWNGTLLDDASLCVEIMNELLLARGKSVIDARRYEELLDFPIRGYYERLGFDFGKERFESVAMEFIDKYAQRWRECHLRRGALDLLRQLQEAGYCQTVLSAIEQTFLDQMTDYYQVRSYFKHLLGLDNHYAASKMDNGRRMMAELGCEAERTLVIGDTVHDYEVACAMGCHSVLIPCGHHSLEKLGRCNTQVLSSFDEVAGYLGL